MTDPLSVLFGVLTIAGSAVLTTEHVVLDAVGSTNFLLAVAITFAGAAAFVVRVGAILAREI